jgi:hypothetical protein
MDKRLINFITEARKRGFSDKQIKTALVNNNWPEKIVEKTFDNLNPKFKSKNQVSIFLSDDILSELEKRAKKNMFNIGEQIEDILRRSCVKKTATTDKDVDDLLIRCFSRKNAGKSKKN